MYWIDTIFYLTFTTKLEFGLLLIFFAQIRLFWNNWSSVIKNHNIDHYSNSISITELDFENKNDIQSTM